METIEIADNSASVLTDEAFSNFELEGGIKLKDGLNLRDVTGGAVFELDEDNLQNARNEENSYFDNLNLFDNMENYNSDDEDNKEDNEESDLSPFESLSKEMHAVDEDGFILKKEMKPGHGCIIPEKSVVVMHYNSYVEYIDEPFDSTRMRNIPFKFVLGKGEVITGLDKAVSTMKKGEYSHFLIKPECAYGKMGCPPRIPPNATILYKVDVVNFYDSAAAIEFEEMTPDEQKKASFEKVLKVCKTDHQMGNDCFKDNRLEAAVTKYRRAIKLLEEISLANEAQDKERQNLLLKLYLNLAICFNKLSKPRPAIANAKRALEIDSNNTKALFNFGKAFTMLGEYSAARKYFYKARKNEPQNKEISQALLIMEEKEKAALMLERDLCQRMFQQKGNNECSSNGQSFSDETYLSEESKNTLTQCIKNFKDNADQSELPFSTGFSSSEKAFIESTAVSLGLRYAEETINSVTQIKILK